MNIYKDRLSNIELLRIVSMLMIVVHHVIVHGINDGTNPVFQITDVFFIFGVNLFVLISGYFTIKLSWKSFISLMWIVAFYKIFHLCADTFVFNLNHRWWEWLAKPLSAPVSGGGWFVDIYILLMLISPLINILLVNLNDKEYRYGLFTILILDCGYSWLLNLHFDAYGYSLFHFVVLYYLGYGVHHFKVLERCNHFSALICSLAVTIALSLFASNYKIPICLSSYNCPLVVFSSICILALFVDLKIKNNVVINKMASSMFAIYLIHDAGNVSKYFYKLINNWYLQFDLSVFVIYVFSTIISLFGFAICVDVIRKILAPYVVDFFINCKNVLIKKLAV